MNTSPAVLFDIDDTLFDHWFSRRQGLARLRQRHVGLQTLTMEQLDHLYQETQIHPDIARVATGQMNVEEGRVLRIKSLFSRIGHPLSSEDALEASFEYVKGYDASRRAVPGALALLDQMKDHIRIGAVSNHPGSKQRQKLTAIGIAPYLETMVTADRVGVMKPDRRIFALALAELNADPRHTLVVGDNWFTDILGARAAGLNAVWFNRFGDSQPTSGPIAEIRSFRPTRSVSRRLLRLALTTADDTS